MPKAETKPVGVSQGTKGTFKKVFSSYWATPNKSEEGKVALGLLYSIVFPPIFWENFNTLLK